MPQGQRATKRWPGLALHLGRADKMVGDRWVLRRTPQWRTRSGGISAVAGETQAALKPQWRDPDRMGVKAYWDQSNKGQHGGSRHIGIRAVTGRKALPPRSLNEENLELSQLLFTTTNVRFLFNIDKKYVGLKGGFSG